jgi:hypothetical protein
VPLWRDRLLGRCRARDRIDVSLYRLPMLLRGAFRASIPAKVEAVRLLQGNPKIYVKIADSGARRRYTFCGGYGTPIYASLRKYDSPQLAARGHKATI